MVEYFDNIKVEDPNFINKGYEYSYNWNSFTSQPILFKIKEHQSSPFISTQNRIIRIIQLLSKYIIYI